MRGKAGTAAIPLEHRCSKCRIRWRQHSDGLCRFCHRAAGQRDHVAAAVVTLRRFIGRIYVNGLFKSDAAQREMFIHGQEAESALDVLAERLRLRLAADQSESTPR